MTDAEKIEQVRKSINKWRDGKCEDYSSTDCIEDIFQILGMCENKTFVEVK